MIVRLLYAAPTNWQAVVLSGRTRRIMIDDRLQTSRCSDVMGTAAGREPMPRLRQTVTPRGDRTLLGVPSTIKRCCRSCRQGTSSAAPETARAETCRDGGHNVEYSVWQST